MSHLEVFLNIHGPQIQLVLFIALFVISWNIEKAAGFFIQCFKWKHASVNARFILTSLPGQLLMGFLFSRTIAWTGHHNFGFLYMIPAHSTNFISFAICFILLDFGEYIYHIVMHKVKTFWMFHMVHHTDEVVDVSTTLREHPGENLIRLSFTLLWVFISGAVFWIVMLRQIIQVFSTLFAHMNYRLPGKVDKVIGLLFITPNLHHTHHHYKQPYTDCNYGDVLSIWDRIFGTFEQLPAEELIFGVDTFQIANKTNNFNTLIKIPFERYHGNRRKKS
jgi:sterol desaturase/sphingolipid hydroxylase (fatty acid hydroxylase superfamily)